MVTASLWSGESCRAWLLFAERRHCIELRVNSNVPLLSPDDWKGCGQIGLCQRDLSALARHHSLKPLPLSRPCAHAHGSVTGNAKDDIPGWEEAEADFFASMSSDSAPAPAVAPAPVKVQEKEVDSGLGAPDVSLAVSQPAPVVAAPIKSTIGTKKVGVKKPGGLGGKKPGGLGAKKGLGAQKAVKDFAEIEREAEMADNVAVMRKEEAAKTVEEQEASMVSMRLAYQDLEIQSKKKDQALASMDPKKKEQMERLGMGFGGNTGFGAKQSHSSSNGGLIVQEEPSGAKKASYQSNSKDTFFDDFEVVEKEDLGWGSKSRVDDICAPSSGMNKSKPSWEQDLNENVSKLPSSKSSNWDNNFDSK